MGTVVLHGRSSYPKDRISNVASIRSAYSTEWLLILILSLMTATSSRDLDQGAPAVAVARAASRGPCKHCFGDDLQFALAAVESVRTLPTARSVFDHVKIMHVIEGTLDVKTAHGAHRLAPGMALALGRAQWCALSPIPRVRTWTIYVDECFLRTQMAWFLPDKTRLRPGVHPHEWDGSPMVLTPGLTMLRQAEPIWRRLATVNDGTQPPEVVAVRKAEYFSQWVGTVIPTFLAPEATGVAVRGQEQPPVNGRLSDPSMVGLVGHAVSILQARMTEPWTVKKLAREVSLSPTHLTRLFVRHTGIPPIRFLTDLRLTEFARSIEETDVSVAKAANAVGWADPRVASAWFSRRFGASPTQFRANPHLPQFGRKRVDQGPTS